MSSEIVIKVEKLSKCYQIYDQPRDRLKQFILPRLQRILGMVPKQYYREFWAMKDVSFEVRKGEPIGIIGRNGSGKSTLLQMVCGTLNPTNGAIITHGRIAALLELGSGFNPEFSGRENVYLNGAVLGLNKDEIDVRFDNIASFADIGEFIEQPVKTYSSGMLVRLAFAVIAHVDADILVIDEALAVGDAFFTQKCMRFLRGFMEHGTIFFVSHDIGAVINLCQKAIWLDEGRCKEIGSPKEIAQKYLAELYECHQGESNVASQVIAEDEAILDEGAEEVNSSRDFRLDFINATKYRNDIELVRFDLTASSFGKGGGTIQSVKLINSNHEELQWLVGGESVLLKIRCLAIVDMFSPIVGFFVSDRLGQALFGDNTYNFSLIKPLQVQAGTIFEANFKFRFPILPTGDYTITVALAEGTQQEHIQHHWIHDALHIKSHSSSVSTGLVGMPMELIELKLI